MTKRVQNRFWCLDILARNTLGECHKRAGASHSSDDAGDAAVFWSAVVRVYSLYTIIIIGLLLFLLGIFHALLL